MNIFEMLPQHLQHIKAKQLTNREKLQQECDVYNNLEGKLQGYDCPVCNNRGFVQKINAEETATVTVECECMKIRRAILSINNSGITERMKNNTFENFRTDKDFQKHMISKAKMYLENPAKCFYIGGQVGCGKTHICTALFVELLRKLGCNGKYIKWQEYVSNLKQAINDNEKYSKLIDLAKYSDVLYIDDFFKNKNSTQADIMQAYNIIDERYNSNKLTLISSERSIEELQTLDEALSSRIKEMCGSHYVIYIKPQQGRNYRLRNGG